VLIGSLVTCVVGDGVSVIFPEGEKRSEEGVEG
jgi:hypothetical protein